MNETISSIMNTKQRKFDQTKDLQIVITAGIGMFLSTLDTGIINVALPTLQGIFHVNINIIAWSVSLYLLALTACIVLFGRISDRIGRMKIYSWGLCVFAIASVACGGSNTAPAFICFRALQGIGAAMLQATSTAIITTYIPSERRGTALGNLGMMIGLGPLLGPSIGGFLLSFASWRWIFWINIPICIIAIYGCLRLPKQVKEKNNSIFLDISGNLLITLSILSLLYGLSTISNPLLPMTFKVVPFFIFLVSLIIFGIWEARGKHPSIPISLFRERNFTIPVFAVTVLGFATSIAFIVPPYFLERVTKHTPWAAGLVNLASPLGLVIFSKFSGKRIGKWRTPRLMAIGLLCMFMSLLSLSFMQQYWSALLVGSLLLFYGIGAGFFVPANVAAIMGAVGPDAQGTIGAIQRMVQNIGIAIGSTFAASLIQNDLYMGKNGLMLAFRQTWLVAALFVLLCYLLVSRIYHTKNNILTNPKS